jgi:putative ATPase
MAVMAMSRNEKTLFGKAEQAKLSAAAPLAVRMRPRTLDEFAGQTHFVGPGKLLRRMLEADALSSLIFYGPPGVGDFTTPIFTLKTSLSHHQNPE